MVEELRIIPDAEITAEQALAMMIYIYDAEATPAELAELVLTGGVRFPENLAHHAAELERHGWIRRSASPAVAGNVFWQPTKLGRRHAATLGIKSIGDDAGHA
jgi:DNA-binding MarR family transcriptional regulator